MKAFPFQMAPRLAPLVAMLLPLTVAAEKPQVMISFSQSSPDSAYWRRYADQLQTRPFDGTVLEIDPRDADWLDESYWKEQIENYSRKPDLGYLVKMYSRSRENGSLNWGGGGSLTMGGQTGPWNPASKYTDKTLTAALADIQAGNKPGQRFTHNMIAAGIQGPTTDWYNDEEWIQRIQNFAVIARFAKQAGLKGMLFDDEQYGEGCVWDYRKLCKRNVVRGKSFDEMRTMARQRGREFAKAMCAEFPDIVFWALHGYSTYAWRIDRGQPEMALSLAPAFYDGMLEGTSDEMIFVDGCETAYTFNTKEHFEFGRWLALKAPIEMGLTQVPDLFRQKVRCGFGLWPDHRGQIDPEDPSNSYFSPSDFQRAIYWALNIGDGYVWLWGEGWTWWVEGPDGRAPVDLYQGRRGLPLEYWTAVDAGRTSPGDDTTPMESIFANGHRLRGRYRCVDGDELPELLRTTQKVLEFPTEGWTFKCDDWGDYKDDPSGFQPIKIGKSWDDQGFRESGTTGWYRFDYTLPPELKDRDVYLYFPDVDGSVWLGINGWATAWRYIERAPGANRQPFALHNLPQHVLKDGQMTLVIKVQKSDEGGGMLAPIQLLAKPR